MSRIPTRSVAALLAATVVVVDRPQPRAWSAALAGIRGAAPAPSLDTLAVLVAGTALWALAGWVLLVLAAGRLATAPGVVGAAGRAVVRVAVPRVLRGIVTGGVAGGLLLGPATAAVAIPAWPTSPAAVATTSTPGPAWPTSPPAVATTSTPGPAWPTSPPAPTTAAPSTPAPSTPAPSTPTTPAVPATPATAAGEVVVGPGDSLWSIAAADLRRHGAAATDAAVAAAWPTWFAVNRAVVGPDPGLLHPGTHLTAPTPTDGSTS